jgi:transposase
MPVDADWFREALVNMGIKPCIPGRKSRSKAIKYDKRRYKKRNRIEIMFGRLKDWRRVATRYDCQRQNNSEPKGNAIYCHFAVGIITA